MSHWERRRWRYRGTFYHAFVIEADDHFVDEIVVDTPGDPFVVGTFTVSSIQLMTRLDMISFGVGLVELGQMGQISNAIHISKQSEV
jgi:hypothetical protein